MICAGFGHRMCYLNNEQYKRMSNKIKDLINLGCNNFYCGGRGDFDRAFAGCVKENKTKNVKLYLILSYYNYKKREEKPNDIKKDEYFNDLLYDDTIYPPIEEKPKKWAISYRNRWIVEQADFLIFCIDRSSGGAYAAYKYAKHQKKPYINLGHCTDED